MSEQDPCIKLTLGDEEFEATPENASLYMHLGGLACYNHVFLEKGEVEEGTLTGTYLFSIIDQFDSMAEYMAANGYPMHVNLRSVAKSDVDAFKRMVEMQASDIDEIPDWMEGGGGQQES